MLMMLLIDMVTGITSTTGPGKVFAGRSMGKYARGKFVGGRPDGVTPSAGRGTFTLLPVL